MICKALFRSLIVIFSLSSLPALADCEPCGSEESKVCGKIDIAPAYVHIDLLDHGDTVDRMDIPAIRGDLCYNIWKGIIIKPTIMWGSNDKELFTTGCGLGHIIPIGDKFYVTPIVGVTYTYLKTNADIELLSLEDLDQTFISWAPYVGCEVTWNITKTWRLYGMGQYAWTRNHTYFSGDIPALVKPFVPDLKENSRGWNWGATLEHDLNKCWSVNLGGGYNSSMSHEKRGMRAYGFKLGIVRWF